MTSLSPARTRLALLALALGGFGIGATEFVAMGLLPEISRDLLPSLAARHPDDAIAQTGIMVSAYALGVVVGAPTIAAAAARFPRKRLLLVLTSAFTVGTVLSAVAPVFPLVVGARFLAGLPHGAYFGVASLVAASLMGPGKRARGVALVLSGLTIANVVGVPAVTWIGQQAGWRIAYGVVALIFAITTVAIALVVPHQAGDAGATIRRELSALRRGQLWLTLGIGAIGFGGFFAVYSYISPLTTEVTGLPASLVPISLVVVGIGMTVGNVIGGRLADHIGPKRSLLIWFPGFMLGLIAVATGSAWAPTLYLGLLLIGAVAGGVGPIVQTRLMDVAGDSQTLAAAINHSALNIGNSLGAALGGAVIAAGLGFVAPSWVGVGLALIGVVLTLISLGLERRSGGRKDAGADTGRGDDAATGPRSEGAGGRVLDEDAVLDRATT